MLVVDLRRQPRLGEVLTVLGELPLSDQLAPSQARFCLLFHSGIILLDVRYGSQHGWEEPTSNSFGV